MKKSLICEILRVESGLWWEFRSLEVFSMGKRGRKRPKNAYCPYCGGKLIFRPAEYLFGDSVGSRSSKNYYVCSNYPDCDAYIACCQHSFEPKGRIANSWLRHERIVAHRYIDLITENRIMPESGVYWVLALNLGVSLHDAHIRFSDDCSIKKIIAILRKILDNNNIGYDVEKMETPHSKEILQED